MQKKIDTNSNMLDTFVKTRSVFIKRPVSTIIEIGAMDCKETLLFSERFPNAKIFSFECNPLTIPECLERIRGKSNIRLIESAVSDTDGMISFFPIDKEKSASKKAAHNPGATSLFKFETAPDSPVHGYAQKETKVRSIKLQTFLEKENIQDVSMVWMDIQGAELLALSGAGKNIAMIDAILLEVEFKRIYAHQPLFPDVKSFLNQNGFCLAGFARFDAVAGDAMFIHKKRTRGIFSKIWLGIIDKTIYPIHTMHLHAKQGAKKTLSAAKNAAAKAKYILSPRYKRSYSQSGEDLILSRIFKKLKISKVLYIDIGANHPKNLNNTFLLSKQGSTGICIEPNAHLAKMIKAIRPKDDVMNIAVSDKKETLMYYSFESDVHNTFSKEESEKNISLGHRLIATYPVEALPLGQILDRLPKVPDLISLDIEGYDEKVLKAFDFTKARPTVWCIETIRHDKNAWSKNDWILDHMKKNGYEVYGDTFINTIFVEKEAMKKLTSLDN